MTLPRRLAGRVSRRPTVRRPPEVEAAAREKRARDHLARKRARDRDHLARSRSRHAHAPERMRRLQRLGPLGFALALFVGWLLAAPFNQHVLLRGAPLERLAIQGLDRLPPEALAASAGALAGRGLDTLDPQTVEGALAREPWIESARTLRLPDGTLVVSVVERRAIARWQPSEAAGPELVDPQGRPFAGAIAPAGPLPRVVGPLSLRGELSDDALEILGEVARHGGLAVAPDALTLYLPEAPQPNGDAAAEPARTNGAGASEGPGYVLELGVDGPRVLLGRARFAQRIARLATLLDEDVSSARQAVSIDLRYADRAVLRTEPAPG